MDIDLMVRYFFCVNYTLKDTRARWMGRLADDTLVNFARLGPFIEKLEARYNPLMEFVFKAHCVDMGAGKNHSGIPQGGSGFVLSRFACRIALKHQISMFQKMLVWEDLSIGRYFVSQGFPPVAMAGNNFLGHGAAPDQLHRLAMGKEMPLCVSRMMEFRRWRGDRCGRFLTPVNEIVFVHTMPYPGWERLLNLAWALWNAPPWVLWWNGFWGLPRFCQEKNETIRNRWNFWNSPRVKWRLDAWY
jgi:hypothetical protein